jgi:hypothetical protein
MRALPGILMAMGIGAVTGLGLTAVSVGGGTGAGTLRIGAWQVTPKAGTTDADPYARAVAARLGALPLALADGLAVIADRDSAGGPLDGRCTYRVAGAKPPARFWTLTVAGADYSAVVAEGVRQGFTSYEIVRRAEAPDEIVVAPEARPGNWLPSGGAPDIRLILRLYDTPIATTISSGTLLPAVTRVGCP